MSSLASWLEAHFLKWQLNRGRGTITGFAEWLGVSRNTYNNWTTRGQTPSDAHLRLLAERLGTDVYDVVGQPRPDPRLQQIITNWGQLPDYARDLLAGAASGQQQVIEILGLAAQLTSDELDQLLAFLERQLVGQAPSRSTR